MKIAGIMTGTSCDGLDVSCLEFSNAIYRPLWSRSAPYPKNLRARVLNCQLPGAKLSLKEFGELHRDLGLWFASALSKILASTPSAQRPDAIACHGQTVAHFPAAKELGFTLQLGDPTRIAAANGLTVISNFRDGDMSSAGEGAPLAPRFHQLIAQHLPEKNLAIHNLGGISNLTYINPTTTIAFDTGPGNCWIDAAAELTAGNKFDHAGRVASQGVPDQHAVKKILALRFFQRLPPKSTGRDDFPFSLLLNATNQRDLNLIATATAITAESIVRAYEKLLPQLPQAIYFCGGGAKNKFLLRSIQQRLPQVRIATLENSQYLESQAFAYFGHLALRAQPLGGPWTGVTGWAPAAHIIPGRNWARIVQTLSREVPSNATRPKLKRKRPVPPSK
jgi:anhydro-N-acetylmuramic acid kinase